MRAKIAEMLRNQSRIWGIPFFHAGGETPAKQYLEIYRDMLDGHGRALVGRLFQEGNDEHCEFVFRYDPNYHKEPISAFPDLGKEYRSEQLWPFFSARIPPIDREDVREAITALNINADQPIEILGKVARLSVTSPYEFQLNGVDGPA